MAFSRPSVCCDSGRKFNTANRSIRGSLRTRTAEATNWGGNIYLQMKGVWLCETSVKRGRCLKIERPCQTTSRKIGAVLKRVFSQAHLPPFILGINTVSESNCEKYQKEKHTDVSLGKRWKKDFQRKRSATYYWLVMAVRDNCKLSLEKVITFHYAIPIQSDVTEQFDWLIFELI
ncbi:polyprotein [Trichinella spiralis]|uniref:Polyprotein n=1 Tax=Trichinella spiralis TaxID=6334 RepID=A0ABR3K949_TRISP